MKKLCLLLMIFCFLFMPLFSEEFVEIPVSELEPDAIYKITGEEILSLFQEIDNLEDERDAWKNAADKAIESVRAHAYKNEQLQIENTLLIGGITLSVGISVCGAIVWAITSF